jgi:hypothetical protein
MFDLISDKSRSDVARKPLSLPSNDQSTSDLHTIHTCSYAEIVEPYTYSTRPHAHIIKSHMHIMHAMMGGMLRVRVENQVTFNVK